MSNKAIKYLRQAAANPGQALQGEVVDENILTLLEDAETAEFVRWLQSPEGQEVRQRLRDAQRSQNN